MITDSVDPITANPPSSIAQWWPNSTLSSGGINPLNSLYLLRLSYDEHPKSGLTEWSRIQFIFLTGDRRAARGIIFLGELSQGGYFDVVALDSTIVTMDQVSSGLGQRVHLCSQSSTRPANQSPGYLLSFGLSELLLDWLAVKPVSSISRSDCRGLAAHLKVDLYNAEA